MVAPVRGVVPLRVWKGSHKAPSPLEPHRLLHKGRISSPLMREAHRGLCKAVQPFSSALRRADSQGTRTPSFPKKFGMGRLCDVAVPGLATRGNASLRVQHRMPHRSALTLSAQSETLELGSLSAVAAKSCPSIGFLRMHVDRNFRDRPG